MQNKIKGNLFYSIVKICRAYFGVSICLPLGFILAPYTTKAQKPFFKPDSIYNPRRTALISGSSAVGVSSLYLYLGTVWYANSMQSQFRWFDDSQQWQQMDKLGHAFAAYQESRGAMGLMRWAGIRKNKTLWLGGMMGFLLQSPIEIFDGFSNKWGASASDLLANSLGSGLCIANQCIWQEQRIQFKFSFYTSPYAQQYPDKLGKNWYEQILKDYNGQTYWLCCRIQPFLPDSKFKDNFPKWLGISLGHGASGMIGGYGTTPLDVIHAREFRRWYIGLDIDLTQINTRSYFLKALFSGINCLHLPLPALEFNRNGVYFHPIKF